MSKEINQPSLEQLIGRRERLENIIGQRRRLAGVLEIMEEGVGSARHDLMLGRAKKLAPLTIERMEGELFNVNQVIGTHEFLGEAKKYRDEVLKSKKQIDEIKSLGSDGYLSSATVRLREQEFKELTSRPGREPELRRALELLRLQEEYERIRQEEGKEEREKTGEEITMEDIVSKVKLSKREETIVAALLRHSLEHPARGLELARLIWDNEEQVPDNAARVRVSVLLSAMKLKLNIAGIKVINITLAGKREAQYYLTKTGQTPSEPTEEVRPAVRKKQEKEKNPTMSIDEETKEVMVGDRKVRIRGKLAWGVFMHLAKVARLTSGNRLLEVTKKLGAKGNSVKDIIYFLRGILEEDPKNPRILIGVRRGKKSSYKLNTPTEFIKKDERKGNGSATQQKLDELANQGFISEEELGLLKEDKRETRGEEAK